MVHSFFAVLALLINKAVWAVGGIAQKQSLLKKFILAADECQMHGNSLMDFLTGKQGTLHPLMSTGAQQSTPARMSVALAIEESEADLLALDKADKVKQQKPLELIRLGSAASYLKNLGIGKVVKAHRGISATSNEVLVRKRLIAECLALVLRNWSNGITGYHQSTAGLHLEESVDEAERLLIIEHCLGQSRNNTVLTRLSPIRGYLKWCDQKFFTIELDEHGDPVREEDADWTLGGWPPSEKQAYEFCKVAESASTAKSFIEALGFMQGKFGFNFGQVFASSRILGLAAIRLGQLPPRRKARVASGHILPKLEVAVCSLDLPVELRVAAGAALVATLTRTRNSDWWHKESVQFTEDRIVALVASTKTSGSSCREEKALVGPILSCTGLSWDKEWLQLRQDEGIPIESWPLLPAKIKGVWKQENASLKDTNELYKSVIERIGEDPTKITSHTWKRTAVTVASLDGIGRDEQAVLAYHKTHKATSAYDASRLEGFMPRFITAVKNFYTKIGWNQILTEDAELTICNTNVDMKGWSDSEVHDSPDSDAGDEDDDEAFNLQSVDGDWGQKLGCDHFPKWAVTSAPNASEKGTGEDPPAVLLIATPKAKAQSSGAIEADSDDNTVPADFESRPLKKQKQLEQDDEPPSPGDSLAADLEEYDPTEAADDGELEEPIQSCSSDEETPSEKAVSRGMLFHMRTGRVHVCGQEGRNKTICGLDYSDALELKYECSEFDLKCSTCFELPCISLPGRQAVQI
jgi:hypothetical protein